jgi:hypothetical protein
VGNAYFGRGYLMTVRRQLPSSVSSRRTRNGLVDRLAPRNLVERTLEHMPLRLQAHQLVVHVAQEHDAGVQLLPLVDSRKIMKVVRTQNHVVGDCVSRNLGIARATQLCPGDVQSNVAPSFGHACQRGAQVLVDQKLYVVTCAAGRWPQLWNA